MTHLSNRKVNKEFQSSVELVTCLNSYIHMIFLNTNLNRHFHLLFLNLSFFPNWMYVWPDMCRLLNVSARFGRQHAPSAIVASSSHPATSVIVHNLHAELFTDISNYRSVVDALQNQLIMRMIVSCLLLSTLLSSVWSPASLPPTMQSQYPCCHSSQAPFFQPTY